MHVATWWQRGEEKNRGTGPAGPPEQGIPPALEACKQALSLRSANGPQPQKSANGPLSCTWPQIWTCTGFCFEKLTVSAECLGICSRKGDAQA